MLSCCHPSCCPPHGGLWTDASGLPPPFAKTAHLSRKQPFSRCCFVGTNFSQMGLQSEYSLDLGAQTRHVFGSILGSARRASGGFPCTRELNFHFCSRTQKGLESGSQNGTFWAPKSDYTHFGAPFVRNWCQKSCIEKRLPNLEG